MSRMTAQQVHDYIEQVSEYDANVIAGMIEKTTAPNAGSVYRINASVAGPDVLEDITKLAILIKVYNDKISGEASDALDDIENAFDKILISDELSGGDYEWQHGTVNPDGSTSGSTANKIITGLIPVGDIEAVTYSGETTDSAGYGVGCYLVEYDKNGEFIQRDILYRAGTETGKVTLDSACAYFKFLMISAGETIEESDGERFSCDADRNIVIGLASAADKTETEVAELLRDVFGADGYGITPMMTGGSAIKYADGGVYYPAAFAASGYQDIGSYTAIRYRRIVTTSAAPASGIAFYTAAYRYISGVPSLGGAGSVGYADSVVAVPSGAKYVRFSYWRVPGNNNSPDFRFWGISNTNNLDSRVAALETGGITAVIPNGEKLAAAYKRAHQMADYEWTNTAAIPSVTQHAGLEANDWVGIPYTSAKENEGFVPTDVSYRTFASALKNPYSLLYTEDTASRDATPNGVSGYGFTYHGTNCGAYFGTVCSQFVCYVLGLPVHIDTYRFPWLERQGIVSRIENPADIKLMDIVWRSGHCALVTDITVDSTGAIQTVYVSESSPGTDYVRNKLVVASGEPYDRKTKGSRTTPYTMADFIAQRITADSGVIYRYNDLYAPTEKSLGRIVADDMTTVNENADICTYAGDFAAFRAGFPVHINYVKGAYTGVVIKREKVTVGTVALPESYNATHSVDVTSYCQDAGRYTAYLTDGTNNSQPTHFEIIDANVTVSGTISNLTVSYNTASNPYCVSVITESGAPECIRQLTAAEIENGSVTFDAKQLTNDQLGRNPAATVYARVMFRGEYGAVCNENVLI